MFSFCLDYYPHLRDEVTMKTVRHESLGIYIYAKPKNQMQRNHNKLLTEKAEGILCERYRHIVNGRYDFFDKEMMKGDFLAYFKRLADNKNSKWQHVYQHFHAFVHGKCTFEEINMDLCNKFREYLLTAPQGLHKHLTLHVNSAANYFRDHPEVDKDGINGNSWNNKPYQNIAPVAQHKELPPKPPSFIERSLMEQSLRHYGINPLHHYLSKIFGKEETSRLFALYKVGTSKKWDGATVYWQIDHEGNIRTGKIMKYDADTGHRIREPASCVTWVHAELRKSDFVLRQCFFGEHLLSDSPRQTCRHCGEREDSHHCHSFYAGFRVDSLWRQKRLFQQRISPCAQRP